MAFCDKDGCLMTGLLDLDGFFASRLPEKLGKPSAQPAA